MKFFDFFDKQIKPTGLLISWGKFRVLWTSSTFYIQVIQFSLILLVAYNDSIRDWLYNMLGIAIPFYVILLIVIIGYIIFCVFEHIVSVPAINQYAATQFYEYGPFKDMDIKLDDILKELKKKDVE